ncbi:MAG: ribose-phosphate pyrophosphokinase [Proteobacteria bacterium]|nr:MAG: ribose-phosphate pyrophosphokinase [Pseudomonadota bacterium]
MTKILNTSKQEIAYTKFKFPSGEVGIKLAINRGWFIGSYKIILLARINSSDDFFELAMIKNALETEYNTNYGDMIAPDIHCVLAKVPYAQQDRVCVRGESLSIEVFANLLNSLNFKTVTIIDPHSDVAPALIKNRSVITQFDLINKDREFINRVTLGNNVFLAPDAGSNKKTAEIAKYFNRDGFIRADKLRNLQTGEIIETIVYCDDFKGQDVIVCDDICLGGKTYIELAKVLKTRNCGKIVLRVSHGVFNKGLDELFNNGIDEIFATNSYQEITDPRVKVLKIENII